MTGSGTVGDPYVIWDVTDLQNIQLNLNSYYELGQDIDASATTGWNWSVGRAVFEGFLPIAIFTGHFDGKDYKITDLYINRDFNDLERLGLFGGCDGAVLSSILIRDCQISGESAWNGPAGIVGALCADMDVSQVTRCSSSGSLYAYKAAWQGIAVGGLLGQVVGVPANPCIISQCYSTATVHGRMNQGSFGGDYISAGGLIAEIRRSTVTDCYARGSVRATWGASGLWLGLWAGGLTGNSDDVDNIHTNCYSTGFVTCDIGGEFTRQSGHIQEYSPVGGPGVVNNCFWDTQTSGQAASSGGTPKTTAEMKDQATFTGWGFGSIWEMDPVGGYPILIGIMVVETNPASNIIGAEATLNGTLSNDDGGACDCGFEWGETTALGNTTATQPKTTGETFSVDLTGLENGKTYYFRAFAIGVSGVACGSILSFITITGSGTVSVMSLPATGVAENHATLNGMVVSTLGHYAKVRFEYGVTTVYGMATSWQDGFTSGDSFYALLTGLAEGSAYHFRAQLKGSGIVSGSDMTFSTLSPLGPVTMVTDEIMQLLEV